MACVIALGCAQLQGLYWQKVSGGLSNCSGSAQGSLVGGRHPCWRSSFPPPTRPLIWAPPWGEVQRPWQAAQLGVHLGPSPLLPGCPPRPRPLDPREAGGLAPQCSALSCLCLFTRGLVPAYWPWAGSLESPEGGQWAGREAVGHGSRACSEARAVL